MVTFSAYQTKQWEIPYKLTLPDLCSADKLKVVMDSRCHNPQATLVASYYGSKGFGPQNYYCQITFEPSYCTQPTGVIKAEVTCGLYPCTFTEFKTDSNGKSVGVNFTTGHEYTWKNSMRVIPNPSQSTVNLQDDDTMKLVLRAKFGNDEKSITFPFVVSTCKCNSWEIPT